MKISRFHISNHSRIQDCDIEVRNHLVLVGPNDSGKSSILRCLNLALGASTAQIYAQLSAADLRCTHDPLTVKVVLSDFTSDEIAAFPDEIRIDPSTNERFLCIQLYADVEADGATLSVRRVIENSLMSRSVRRDDQQAFAWHFLSATQTASRDIQPGRTGTIELILKSLDLGEERENFDELIRLLSERLEESSVLGDLRAKLADRLSRALPQEIEKDHLAFVPNSAASADPLSDARLRVMRRGDFRDLTEQSDGTRALFAMAFNDLVSETSNIVAIDEPELHLHPSSQRTLAKLFRDGPNQKILASHSPDIVGAFPPESIVSVRKDGHVVQPSRNFLNSQDKLIARWWVKERLEPLTADHVVWVEGPSDRILLSRVAELLHLDLDRNGLAVAELGGVGDFGHIVRLFGDLGFQSPFTLLIDQDAEAGVASKLGCPVGDLEVNGVLTCRRDLEDEYVAAIGYLDCLTLLRDSGFFSHRELQTCVPTGPNGSYQHDDIWRFCKSKKILSAIAVGAWLSPGVASRLGALSSVVARLKTLR